MADNDKEAGTSVPRPIETKFVPAFTVLNSSSVSWGKRFKLWRLQRLLADTGLVERYQGGQLTQGEGASEGVDKIKAPAWVGLLGAGVVLGIGALKPFIPVFPPESVSAYWAEILPLFGAEVGVALMVAHVIALAIDAQAKRREERAREREKAEDQRRREAELREAVDREQRMVQDVFRGVLGIRHASAYVRKVIETTLEQKVIRRSVNLIYTLRPLNTVEEERIGEKNRFIVMDQAVSFEFQNLSSEEIDVPVVFVVPVRHGQKLREESKLLAMTIGGEPEEVVEQNSADDSKKYKWEKKIPAFGKLTVSASARLIKELSDTEVWCSYYPCSEGMSLQVVAPKELHMGIRNNTASRHRMETDPCDTGIGVWKIEGPILPNDSVVFYWRTPLDEGETPEETAMGGCHDEPAKAGVDAILLDK